jgi:hypothetical protein
LVIYLSRIKVNKFVTTKVKIANENNNKLQLINNQNKMIMKKVILILALILTGNIIFAQDTPLEISGSADVYYKYDFAKKENIGTSFATQNSVSLGMLDIALKKQLAKPLL